jgi:glycosyltransferase involved in cell wall biosynthesis
MPARSIENNALVSVVVPAYNAQKSIGECLEAALNQTSGVCEVIVVDDASEDETAKEVEAFHPHVRLLRHSQNLGGSAARNHGVSAATGRYIAFLDSDDIWYPNKIETQVRAFAESSNVGGLGALYCLAHDREGNVLGNCRNGKFGDDILTGKADIVSSSGLVVLRSAYDSIGGFDELFSRHQDLEFMIRLMRHWNVGCVPAPLYRKIHSGSPSYFRATQGIHSYWEAFSKEIDALGFWRRRLVYARGYLRRSELAAAEGMYRKAAGLLMRSLAESPAALWQKRKRYLRLLTTRLGADQSGPKESRPEKVVDNHGVRELDTQKR